LLRVENPLWEWRVCLSVCLVARISSTCQYLCSANVKNVLKNFTYHVMNTFTKRYRYVHNTLWKRYKNVNKTLWRRSLNVLKSFTKRSENILKTFTKVDTTLFSKDNITGKRIHITICALFSTLGYTRLNGLFQPKWLLMF
jgi:hypothetical protein